MTERVRTGSRWAACAVAAAACLAGLSACPAAHARDLKVVGVWTAFVVTNTKGQRVCGVETTYPDGREFDLDWFESESVLTIQIMKKGWDIPPHVRPRVSLNFPGVKPWEAKGLDLDHVTHMIELSIPHDTVQRFSHDMANAAAGTISFPGGSEPAWDLDMTGFEPSLREMVGCIDDIAGSTSTTTPYAYMHRPQPGTAPTPPLPPTGSRSSSDMRRSGGE